MLTPEQAREAIAKFEKKHWKAKLLARLALQPVAAFKFVSTMVEHDRPLTLTRLVGQYDADSLSLDDSGPKTRKKLFQALFPDLWEHVESAWNNAHHQPYSIGWMRRPFRAPDHPQVTRPVRVRWLLGIARTLCPYDGDVEWLAQWAPHLPGYIDADALGKLLAAAIDSHTKTGDRVFEILCQSARGEHEIGRMGSHVVTALLTCSRPEAWEFMEKMLLAAQREEGLRQSIVASVDEAHPEAFKRMLRLILEHDLIRFSSVVFAMDVWLGFRWDSAATGVVKRTLTTLLRLLEDETVRDKALGDGDAETCYLALWSHGYFDAGVAVPKALQLLSHKEPERRFAAVEFLVQSRLDNAKIALITALGDEDERIIARALHALDDVELEDTAKPELFDLLTKLVGRLPKKKKKLPSIVWPWSTYTLEKTSAGRLFDAALCGDTVARMESHLEYMAPSTRASIAKFLGKPENPGKRCRSLLFALVSDSSESVRSEAFDALSRHKITADEAPQIEALLTRKPGDLRRAAIGLLLSQKDAVALASAERLIGSDNELQCSAGDELLQLLQKNHRAAKEIAKLRERSPSASSKQRADRKTDDDPSALYKKTATLGNYLGLLDPTIRRTPPTKPRARNITLITDAALGCIHALDKLICEHRETEVTRVHRDGSILKILLGAHDWVISRPDSSVPMEASANDLPLKELWEKWWEERPDELRDDDGLELVRAMGFHEDILSPHRVEPHGPLKKLLSKILDRSKPTRRILRYPGSAKNLIFWLSALHPSENLASFALDAMETSLASVPSSLLEYDPNRREWEQFVWRRRAEFPYGTWTMVAGEMSLLCPDRWKNEHFARLWGLLRWIDEPGGTAPRYRPSLTYFFSAYRAGAATTSDFLDLLIGRRPRLSYSGPDFHELRHVTERRRPAELMKFPDLVALVDEVHKRVIDIELDRGETPGEVSAAALTISSIIGSENLIRILKKFGKGDLQRGWLRREESRDGAFSHMIRVSFPAENDTPERFKELVEKEKLPEKRLLELAVFVPHWARFVEHTVAWPGLTEAAWWLHAHTKDDRWQIDQETRDQWAAEMSQRTPLLQKNLVDGAVDVDWFNTAFNMLGRERWSKLFALARFASSGTGHARAVLFADAMQGKLSRDDLMTRISDKRNKDAARALGLLPLAQGKERKLDLLERYELLQEFLRTSRKFGSQRRASEKRAVEIGMENLARTSGFPDPLRLQWAMEIESMSDLAKGPVRAIEGDVTVELSIDEDGSPELTVSKKGKPLKAVSSALKKKFEAISDLCERKTQLKRQRSRIRVSLEEAMCRGDQFTGGELAQLMSHPMLAPSVRRLVMVSKRGIGYPGDDGSTLRHHSGKTSRVGEDDPVHLAHPHDLFESNEWHAWQKECFSAERVQPFKQVFRELYVLTEAEKQNQTDSVRYAGHQVNPRQALATIGTRGWVHHEGEGVTRTFHKESITAHVDFDQYFTTPAEVEGLTVHGVHFTRRGEWNPIDLKEVPPRLFSESMRDIDLMVSVAHRGGVDPEATASTIEMRAALVRETCTFLRFENVRFNSSHVLVDGQIGNYSVHLGSGVVHRMPGGMLCIVPVHAHHRGRLFLPFADDDPKTAEVLTKVLLLAEDTKIKDPTILDQLKAR